MSLLGGHVCFGGGQEALQGPEHPQLPPGALELSWLGKKGQF